MPQTDVLLQESEKYQQLWEGRDSPTSPPCGEKIKQLFPRYIISLEVSFCYMHGTSLFRPFLTIKTPFLIQSIGVRDQWRLVQPCLCCALGHCRDSREWSLAFRAPFAHTDFLAGRKLEIGMFSNPGPGTQPWGSTAFSPPALAQR